MTVLYVALGLVTVACCMAGGILAAEKSGVDYYNWRWPVISIGVMGILVATTYVVVSLVRAVLGIA